ncbi:MAG TPA: hypothetical protein VG797_02155 [Phycisphaerales bacterium]|nr:hypothetical protein [Phycisphaerales bacterium]
MTTSSPPGSPEEGVAPILDERPWFSRAREPSQPHDKDSIEVIALGNMAGDMVILSIAGSMAISYYVVINVLLAARVGAPTARVFADIAMWVIIIGAVGFFAVRAYHRATKFLNMPPKPSQAHRVNVIAASYHLEELKQVRDQFFEPIVVPFSLARFRDPAKPAPRWRRILFVTVFYWLLIGIGFGIVQIFGWLFLGGWIRPNLIIGIISFACIRLPLSLIVPSYLRFVPGRMDVISYGWFSRGPIRVRSYDLRTTRVLLSSQGISVRRSEDERWHSVIWAPATYAPAVFSPDREKIQRAALMAAVSSAEAPHIPEGQLTG